MKIAKNRRRGYDLLMAATRKTLRAPAQAVTAGELLEKFPGARAVTFTEGAWVFRENSRATSCYLITQGRVRIIKKSDDGEDIPLALVKPGEFLGEMAMLSGKKRSASAQAVTPVAAIVIEHDQFVALLKKQNPFAIRLSHQLASLLATRCHHLLRLIAHQPDVVPLDVKIPGPVDVRAVLSRVHMLWAV